MKTEMLISAAIMLTAFTIPITCATSPPAFEASAAQEDTTATVIPLDPVIDEPVLDTSPITEGLSYEEEQAGCDVMIDSMSNKSSNIDEDISEIKKDLEELKKRKKRKKITKKKRKKKKVVDK